jgi:hypothetical protein
MDISDYGIHPEIGVPPSAAVFDLTPLLDRVLDGQS